MKTNLAPRLSYLFSISSLSISCALKATKKNLSNILGNCIHSILPMAIKVSPSKENTSCCWAYFKSFQILLTWRGTKIYIIILFHSNCLWIKIFTNIWLIKLVLKIWLCNIWYRNDYNVYWLPNKIHGTILRFKMAPL